MWKPCANTVLPCTYEVDAALACRFEDDTPLHRETLLCPICCPNCHGGTGLPSDLPAIHEMMQEGIIRPRKDPPSE